MRGLVPYSEFGIYYCFCLENMAMFLDYNTVINQTSLDVKQSKKAILFYFSEPVSTFVLSSKQAKIKKTFNYQLIVSIWLLTDLEKSYEAVSNKDLSKEINLVSNLVKLNIEVQANIDSQINKPGCKDAELALLNKEIQETIANFYSCLRILKKANKKEPIETTELAKGAVGRTAKTLRTIYAN